jgi:hypothetical protein
MIFWTSASCGCAKLVEENVPGERISSQSWHVQAVPPLCTLDHRDWTVYFYFYSRSTGVRSTGLRPKNSRTRNSPSHDLDHDPWCRCGYDYLLRNVFLFDHLRPLILEASLDHHISRHRVVWSCLLLFQGLSEASEGTTPRRYIVRQHQPLLARASGLRSVTMSNPSCSQYGHR